MLGPHGFDRDDALQTEHVIFARLDLLLSGDLVHEHGDGGGLRVERLLHLDVQPALADEVEADRRAVGAHHHDVAGLLAGGFQRSHAGHGKMRRMAEDQVDVGISQQLIGDDGAGIARLPLHGRKRDDRDLREGLQLLLEPLLDVERVGVAGIAQHLQDLALDRAVLLGEQPLRLVGGDMADLDRSGDRGQVGRGRGDLAVELHDRNAGGARRLDRRLERVEIDGGKHDRRRA